ncbi:hypothetical protein Syun_021723 [Stephania yunnanensis]|uniref:non-specific serine/threonine protein kinase n=1 Tax=Stephania yunnanensis TaxID=152371 RepID=A0AAP0NSI7_9MAGN
MSSIRMLVYEYIDNGNLEQWLHGDVGLVSPLTWEIRMNIILGTAKGLAYLHECLEPKVVHRDVKSSNILLDRQWNAKVSDFGLAKLLFSERSYVTTRVMGTYGLVYFTETDRLRQVIEKEMLKVEWETGKWKIRAKDRIITLCFENNLAFKTDLRRACPEDVV